MKKETQILNKNCLHKNSFFDNSSGELICTDCAQVIDKLSSGLDSSSNFLDERLLFDDLANFSIIPSSNVDHSSSYIPNNSRSMFVRLRRLDTKSKSESSAFRDGFFLLKKLHDNLGLTRAITQYAAYVYRKAYQKRIRIGGSITNLVYPSIYIACNELGSPRQISEILKFNPMSRKQFFRGYKKMFFSLEINTALHNPILILQRLGANLQLSEKIKRDVVSLLSDAKKEPQFCGYNRATLVAAAVYLLTSENKTSIPQHKIAKEFGISDVSLRNCYFKLRVLRPKN